MHKLNNIHVLLCSKPFRLLAMSHLFLYDQWTMGMHVHSVHLYVQVTHYNVWYIFFRYRKHCTISRKPGSGRPSKISNHVQRIVEHKMWQDYETTATQLHELLIHKWNILFPCALCFVAENS